jgi:hypothetical protein
MVGEENPPFPRGETFFGTSETVDTTSGAHLEGKEFQFRDVDPRSVGSGDRTGRVVTCRVVRNMSGTTIYGGYLCTFRATAGKFGGQVDGLVDTSAELCYPADEYLPSAGVRDKDLFYIVVGGPALIKTPLSGDANNVFSVGSMVVGLTAATSGATTAGRAVAQDLTGATAPLGNNVQNRIGVALSAATTANTNSTILVDVFKKW